MASALAEVLSTCSSVDNARRKSGEEKLKQLSKSADYLPQLLQCAQSCSELQVRAVADRTKSVDLQKPVEVRPVLLPMRTLKLPI